MGFERGASNCASVRSRPRDHQAHLTFVSGRCTPGPSRQPLDHLYPLRLSGRGSSRTQSAPRRPWVSCRQVEAPARGGTRRLVGVGGPPAPGSRPSQARLRSGVRSSRQRPGSSRRGRRPDNRSSRPPAPPDAPHDSGAPRNLMANAPGFRTWVPRATESEGNSSVNIRSTDVNGSEHAEEPDCAAGTSGEAT